MGKKGIVCFDLDMTLLNHKDWTIPASAIKAVRRLRKDYLIVIASGRDMDNRFSRQYKELIRPDAIVHLNGTKVTAGDQVIFQHFMDRGLLKRLLGFVRDKPYAIGITRGNGDYYINSKYVVEHDILRWKESRRCFRDPSLLAELDIQTLTYIGPPEGAKEIEAAFPELKLPMFSSANGADVVEKVASKAEGLKHLCDYYQIPISSTFAFGDSMNDYEIIQAAGVGIAMGNALESLKQVADYVTDRIEMDGVYKACLLFGLIK